MLLGLLAVAVVGIVAYFHFVQGFFSATLSALLAIIAAAVALSFHEVVVAKLLQGKLPEYAHALTLAALFAGTYGILRMIFDSAVPGNLHVPLLVERIGAGVMGVVAGVFAAGILLIAIQSMPFEPSIAGFARYEMSDVQVVTLPPAPGRAQELEAPLGQLLKDETLAPSGRRSLIIPVDDIVMGVVSKLSGNGALGGAVSLVDRHPAWLDELFFQRLGIQLGARHVAYNLAEAPDVQVQGLFTTNTLAVGDSELPKIVATGRWTNNTPPKSPLSPDKSTLVLIVRTVFSHNNADADSNVRVSPATVRLMASGSAHIPFGTLDQTGGTFVRATRPDDFIVVPADGIVDFVFVLPAAEVVAPGDPKAPMKIADSVFFEAKRMAGTDLSGMAIAAQLPPIPTGPVVLRKANLQIPKGVVQQQPTMATPAPSTPGAPAAPGAAPAPMTGAPIEFVKAEVSTQFLFDLNVGNFPGDGGDVTFNGGRGTIKERKIFKLDIEPTATITELTGGTIPVRELFADPEQRLVVVSLRPAAGAPDPWTWADYVGKIQIVNTANEAYQPSGVWAKVMGGNPPAERLVMRYNAEAPVLAPINHSEGRPTDIWFAYLVPMGTQIQELRFNGTRVAPVTVQAN